MKQRRPGEVLADLIELMDRIATINDMARTDSIPDESLETLREEVEEKLDQWFELREHLPAEVMHMQLAIMRNFSFIYDSGFLHVEKVEK